MLKRITVEYYKWINEETGEEFTNHEDAIKSVVSSISDKDIEFFADNGNKYTLDELFDYHDYNYIDENDFYAVKVKTQKGIEFVKKCVTGDIRDLVIRYGIGNYVWDEDREEFVNYDSTMSYYERLYNKYFNKGRC